MHTNININKAPIGKNIFVLFGHEAIEARPNLDPYTSSIRVYEDTQQVFTTDVHIKHHVRRGIKTHASETIGFEKTAVFYEKFTENGECNNFDERLAYVRQKFGVSKNDPKDAYENCLDLPLFGYVHAIKKENFNACGSIGTLFRPSTFHSCRILSLGKNNAFPTGEKESSGSAVQDILEYGSILSLWEIDLNTLRGNAEHHKIIKWSENGQRTWIDLFLNGIWRAYSDCRYSSVTQRSQFASFIVAWEPAREITAINPKDLIHELKDPDIDNFVKARVALKQILPGFLHSWGYETPLVEKNLTKLLA